MRYQAHLDFLSKFITNAFIISALVILFFTISDTTNVPTKMIWFLYIIIPVIIIAWALSPQYYLVTDTAVVVKRPFKSIHLPIAEISGIRTVTNDDLGTSIRLFGIGGLFGYLGIFSSNVIGNHQRWCTNKENLVLIECKNRKVLISPSDPVAFVRNVNNNNK